MENQLTPNNSMILEIRELLENARKNTERIFQLTSCSQE